MPYIQIRKEESSDWITLSERDYFRMQTFGYRTRLFEALYLAVDDPPKSSAVQKQLAHWIAKRYQIINRSSPVRSVRFVAGLYRADPKREVRGHWAKPAFETFKKEDTYEISRHNIAQKQ